MNRVNKEEFISRISKIHSAISATGKEYSNIQVCGTICMGIRRSTSNSFEISLDELYKAYKELDVINTATLKKYVDRVQSPSFAILKEAKLI